jgi:outer membrane receptor protein involved in Fe transport
MAPHGAGPGNNMAYRTAFHAGVAVVATAGALPAIAQDAAPPVDEIIVTAQRRAQSIQEVPLAVSAYSDVTLQQAGINDVKDLAILSPSLVVTSTQAETAGTTIRIRGVGTTGDNVGLESSVAVFIDGVYRNRNNLALTELGNIERVEVLRGPQGTLFGKNASAGLIQVITKGPDTEEFGAYGELSYGDYDFTQARAGITGPIAGERLAFSLDGSVTQRDGFVDDIANPGVEYNDRDRWLLRGQLSSQITDALDLRIIADVAERDEQCCAAVTTVAGPTAAGIALAGGQLVNPPRPDDFVMTSNANRGYRSQVSEVGLSAELNWELPVGTLTSITAWRDWEAERSQDIDFTSADILFRPDGSGNDFETVTQELRLAGQNGKLDWLVGFFYVNEQLTLDEPIRVGAGYEAFGNVLLAASGAPNLSVLTGLPAGSVFTAGQGIVSDNFEQDSDSYALFTHNIWSFTDRLDGIIGLRYTTEEKDLGATLDVDNPACDAAVARLTGGVIPPQAGPAVIRVPCLPLINPFIDSDRNTPDGRYAGSRTDREWTGTLGLAYDLTEDWLAYGSYSRGYKAGGFNLDRAGFQNPLVPPQQGGGVPTVDDLEFDPELVDSFELGAKGSLWDNRVQLGVTAFYAEFQDFQLNLFTGLNFLVLNLDEVTSQGVEVEFQVTPTDGLTFSGGVAYTDASYDDGNPDPIDPTNGQPIPLAGQRLTNAPYWTATAVANYERSLGDRLRGFVNVNYRFNGDMNTGSDLDVEKEQASFSLWDLRLGLGDAGERWTFEVWAQNLFDQTYQQVAIDAPLQGSGTGPGSTQTFAAFLGDPRLFGATVRVKF